jgi:hypothetical protein
VQAENNHNGTGNPADVFYLFLEEAAVGGGRSAEEDKNDGEAENKCEGIQEDAFSDAGSVIRILHFVE